MVLNRILTHTFQWCVSNLCQHPSAQVLFASVENGRIDVISCPDVNEIVPFDGPVPAQSACEHAPSRPAAVSSASAQRCLILTPTDAIGSKNALKRVACLLGCDVSPAPQINRLQNSPKPALFLILLLELLSECLNPCPEEVVPVGGGTMKYVLPTDAHALRDGQNPSYLTSCGWRRWVITLLGCVGLVCIQLPQAWML